jgi:putative spermidine/putrescine transport system permease protein
MTFAFIISFNNIPLSVFLVRPGQTTLPITVINYMEYSLDPVLAAVNVASLIFILATIFLFEKLGGFSAQIHGGSK